MTAKVVNGWSNASALGRAARKAFNTPPRQCARWTAEEEQDMLGAIFRGADIEQIARYHQRSIGGISSRIGRLWELYPEVPDTSWLHSRSRTHFWSK